MWIFSDTLVFFYCHLYGAMEQSVPLDEEYKEEIHNELLEKQNFTYRLILSTVLPVHQFRDGASN